MNAPPNLDACRTLVEQLRAHDCAAMVLLLERSLPDVAATTKALDVIWRDLANIAAGRGMLADAYANLAHPRWAARERRRYDVLEGLSEIALGALQAATNVFPAPVGRLTSWRRTPRR
mgnify:CR=1 FL=1